MTRSNTNQAVQSRNKARSLKLCIQVEEELHYPSGENKGADHREADLRLCFRKCKLFVFSCEGSLTISLEIYLYVPPPKGWGTYCFWCGSRRRRRSFLSARYLLNHWMDLDQTGTEPSLGQPNGVIRFW